MVGNLVDIAETTDLFDDLPKIDFSIIERLHHQTYSKLASREVDVSVALEGIEPIVKLPDNYTIDRHIDADYFKRLYDKDLAEEVGVAFIRKPIMSFERDFALSVRDVDTAQESVTRKIVNETENVIEAFQSTSTIEDIGDVFDRVQKVIDLVEGNKDVIYGRDDLTKTWLDKVMREDVTDIREISDKVRQFIKGYSKLATTYMAARFQPSTNIDFIRDSLISKYRELVEIGVLDDVRDRLKEIQDNNYIEKIQEYQDKHVFKGKVGEATTYMPLGSQKGQEEFQKLVDEEKEFVIKAFDLENIMLKNIVNENRFNLSGFNPVEILDDMTIADVLRSRIAESRFEDLTPQRRIENLESGVGGYVAPRRTVASDVSESEGGVTKIRNIPSDIKHLLDYEAIHQGINVGTPFFMHIQAGGSIARTRSLIRHELVHSVKSLVLASDTEVEKFRSAIINSGKKGLSRYLSQIMYRFGEVATDLEKYYTSSTVRENLGDTQRSRVMEAFQRAFSVPAMSAEERNEFINKLRGVESYFQDVLDRTRGAVKKIQKAYTERGHHGRSIVENIQTLEGAPATDVLSDTLTDMPIVERAILGAPLNVITRSVGSNKYMIQSRAGIRAIALKMSSQFAPSHVAGGADLTEVLEGISSSYFAFLYAESLQRNINSEKIIKDALMQGDIGRFMEENVYTIAELEEKLSTPLPSSVTDIEGFLVTGMEGFVSATDAYAGTMDTEDDDEEEEEIPPHIFELDPPVQALEQRREPRVPRPPPKYREFEIYRPTPLNVSLKRRIVRLNEVDIVKLFQMQDRIDKMAMDQVCTS